MRARGPGLGELPSGTVTFLFTDIEGSTRLWREHPEAMGRALARHDVLLRDAIEGRGGRVVKTTGDGAHAAFTTAGDAVEAAVAAQRALGAEVWDLPAPLRVRMGIHSGPAELRDGDYYGTAVNRAARIMSVASGGQVLVSRATEELARDAGIQTLDLGDHRLKDLGEPERLFQILHPDLAREFPPLRTLDGHTGNLPRQMTSFVGRAGLVAEVAALVRSRPLVTLTGVGGVGKTRLALEVAATVAGGLPDGAWLCELAPVTDPDAVWDTVAATFGLPPMPGRRADDLVLDYLGAKRLLLVVDNCEHLLSAVASVVERVCERCDRVVLLATSREGLAVAGEQIVAVRSLDVPADGARGADVAHAESVELFCDRARAVRSDFTLTDHNEVAIGVLCRRLDGIPLAIELAAARARSLAPEDLVERLDQRFRLLTRGSRAALERHQTLRNTIDWSYQLLDEVERTALNRLSVFAGGCDLRGAEAVLGHDGIDPLDVVDVVDQLVDKSLVLAEPDADGHVRYRLLESIRQYAQEQLEGGGDAAPVRERHADHYVAFAETAGSGLRNPDQLRWLGIVAQETDNFRAALDWSVETTSADHALRLVAPLTGHRPVGSTMAWAEAAVGVPGASEHPLLPVVASWAAYAAVARGDLAAADRYAALVDVAAARLGTDSVVVPRCHAFQALFRGDLDGARANGEEWVARARRTRDDYELAEALTHVSLVQAATGSPAEARESAEEALAVGRASGIPYALVGPLLLVPWSLLDDDPERARRLFDEGREMGSRIGDPFVLAMAVTGTGVCCAAQGEWDAALDAVRIAIDGIARAGNLAGLIGGTLGVAAVALTGLGHLEAGAIVLGASYHFAPAAYERPEQLRSDAAATLVDRLGPGRYEELRARGAGLSADDAMATLTAALDARE